MAHGRTAAAVGVFALLAATVLSGQEIEFNRDIRPILSDQCFACHGPDAAKRKTKLRFDTEAGARIELAKAASPSCRAIRSAAKWSAGSLPPTRRPHAAAMPDAPR